MKMKSIFLLDFFLILKSTGGLSSSKISGGICLGKIVSALRLKKFYKIYKKICPTKAD